MRVETCRDFRAIVHASGWHEDDYSQIDWQGFQQAIFSKDVDKAYASFCTNFENMVCKAHQRTSQDTPVRQFLGRTQPKIVSQQLHAPVVPNSRHGEPQFPFDDAPICLRQRIRQARRIKTVISQVQNVHRLDDADRRRLAYEAVTQTWVAVVRSTGFQGGFLKFATQTLGLLLPHWLRVDDLPLLHLLDDLHKKATYVHEFYGIRGRIHFNTIRRCPNPRLPSWKSRSLSKSPEGSIQKRDPSFYMPMKTPQKE